VFPDACGLTVREFIVNNDVTTALIAERVTG